MISIIGNELYKIFRSKRIYIFLAILLVFSVGIAFLVSNITPSEQISAEMIDMLKGPYFPAQILSIISDLLLPIFATLIITFLISDEYDNGTLKLPLLHGFSRGRVIISKVIAGILVTVLMLLFVLVAAYGMGLLLWGSRVVDSGQFVNTLKAYSLTVLPFITLILLTAFIAILVKNSGIVIGVMVAIFVLGSFVSGVFPNVSTYLPTYYLKAFASSLDKINYSRALLVCGIYGVAAYAAAYLKFFRMEIQK